MANSVYDPEQQSDNDLSEPRTIHKNPTESSENDADDRDSLRTKESGGSASTGSSGGGNFSFNSQGDQSDKGSSLSSAVLSGRESGGSTGSAGSFNFNPGKSGKSGTSGFKNFFLGSTKRKRITIGGGAFGSVLVGGGVLTLFLFAGPSQLIQLSQLLQHNFSVSQSDSESRTNSLLRSYKVYKTGDYRYSRVGLMGARSMTKIVGQFEDAGVKFTGSDVLGRPTAIEVDRSVVQENFPETKGMSDAEFNDFLNGKFSVDSGLSFETAAAGESYKLDIKGLKAQSISSFINKASTQLLGNSKAITAMKARGLKDFLGLDSLFHPFSRAIQNKIAAKAAEIQKNNPKESDGAAKEEAASEVADSEFSDNVSPIEAPGEEAFTQAHDTENSFSNKIGSKLLPGAGALWAAGCTLKGISGAIVTMNRTLVVLPSAVEATQLVSMGSQVQNGGNDITMAQVGATVKGFSNSQGQSIWSGAALQATEGSNKANSLPKNSNGQIENNLPGEYQQAFGTDTTSSTLNSAGDVLLSWFPFHWVSVPGVSECGFVGGLSIVIAGIGFQAVNAVINLPDADVGDVALNAAAQAGEQTVIQGVQGKLLGPIIDNVVKRIAKATVAPALTREAFSGATGGNLIAYGARAAANSSAILNGGLALGNNASTIIGSVGHEQQQQFRSENFFARMFDVNDYRSLAGHLATDISPSVGTNLQLGINNTLNIGGILTSVFGNLLPHVAADGSSDSWTGNYYWGFPQYGIPDNMLNDPALSDPTQNAEKVGQYLSSVCNDGKGNIGSDKGACNGSNGYTARIMACFGDNLTYTEDSDVGAEAWDLTHSATAASSDVNPVSDAYLGANCGAICPDTIADCGNSGKEQWEKIVMFVNDAFNIKALDCADGSTDTSDQSCQDTGNSQAGSSASPSTPTATGNLTNPFPDGWTPGRLDMGYDGAFKNKIVSPCDGKVIYYVNSQGPHSWEGDYVVVQCSSAIPGLPSNAFYFAEGITATVKQGPVTAGQQIAVPGPTGFSEGPGGIEWGLADPNNPGNALAESGVNGMTDCSAASKAMVLSFSQWVVQNLGVAGYDTSLTDNTPGCA